jgi:hypothetical protein
MSDNHLINPFMMSATITDDLAILFHRNWQCDALASTCNFGFDLGTLSMRHVGFALGGVLANHASILP